VVKYSKSKIFKHSVAVQKVKIIIFCHSERTEEFHCQHILIFCCI
jgi:hypothetical protein